MNDTRSRSRGEGRRALPALLILVMLGMAGCGGGGGGATTDAGGGVPLVAGPAAPEVSTLASSTLGPGGGTLTVASGPLAGTRVTLPPGALAQPTTFTISGDPDALSEEGYVTQGSTFDILPHTQLLAPATIEVPNGANLPFEGLVLLHRDGTAVSVLAAQGLGNGGGSAIFQTSSFSSFALAEADGLPVTIVNHSGQPAENVYITVSAQDEPPKDTPITFYYLDFFGSHAGKMVEYPIPNPAVKDANTLSKTAYAIPLSKLSDNGDGKPPYRFICPTVHMVSGRIYFSIGEGVNIGLVNALNGQGQVIGNGLQSPPFGPGQDTPADKVELSCTNALYANITNVDFFSFSFSLQVTTKDGTVLGPVGFNESRQDIMKDLIDPNRLPVAFRGTANRSGTGFVLMKGTKTLPSGEPQDGYTPSNVLRVLAPNQVIAQGAIDSSALETWLDNEIANGWSHYAVKANRPPDLGDGLHSQIAFPPDHPQFKWKFLDSGDPELGGAPGTSANELVFYCTFCADPVGLTGLNQVIRISKPTSDQVFSNEGGPLANAGTDGEKRIKSLISAAVTRGVFTSYVDWGNPSAYYPSSGPNPKHFNSYSQVLHAHALAYKKPAASAPFPLCYAFGYDDVYDQDPTISTPFLNGNVKEVTITFNPF